MTSAAVALLTSAVLFAQPAEPPSDRQGPPGGPGGPGGGRRGGGPPPPVMNVLDTDRDGELSAAEIASAPQALLTLDKNGDGKLDREELRPMRPEGGPDRKGPPPPKQ